MDIPESIKFPSQSWEAWRGIDDEDEHMAADEAAKKAAQKAASAAAIATEEIATVEPIRSAEDQSD